MSTAFRLSKKTFFAAAAAGLFALVPAQAYIAEDTWWRFPQQITVVDNPSAETYRREIQTEGGWGTFVKMGSGVLQVTSLGDSGLRLYNGHFLGYSHDNNGNNDGAYYTYQVQNNVVIADGREFIFATASDSRQILNWRSGELVVDDGVLNLTGYVNAWFDFGSGFNSNYLGQSTGAMTGVSRITVRDGAVLDLSGNNNFQEDNIGGREMVAAGSYTTFQFLNNLQAGDVGTDTSSTLRLGSSSAFHVNLHVGGWDENERADTGVSLAGNLTTSRFDTQLAFGGSIGVLAGAGNVYKTGDGAFTLLSSSEGFTGSLYAAGGSFVLAADDSVGSMETFTDVLGNEVVARVESAVGNAASVNIAGTFNSGSMANGGSMQGAGIGSQDRYEVVEVAGNVGEPTTVYVAVKESYFTTPSAGTLVIAENQTINNFQSYFAGGYRVTGANVTAERAVLLAANDSEGNVLAPMESVGTAQGTYDAPIIAGTGVGSSLVIPGGNYTQQADGSWVVNTDENGTMQGGVLVINQQAGMGGVYEGSVVGARVTIYDKTAFYDETDKNETLGIDEFTNDKRLNDAKVTAEDIRDALKLFDTELARLDIADDGSFALDNDVAWRVVEYYKAQTGNDYYVDYAADADVKGGVVVLKGAGDLAFTPEVANFSGIVIDENRTGKTVLNIASLNSLEGMSVRLSGNQGTVAFVVSPSDTMSVKLSGFGEGTSLVFTTSEDLNTLSGAVVVGKTRQGLVGFTETQEEVRGNVYVERGVGLNLTGSDSVFANASSVVLWRGNEAGNLDGTEAAPTLNVYTAKFTETDDAGQETVTYDYAGQLVHNLTGDSTARVNIGDGSLTVITNTNESDARSGLTYGTYDGVLSGTGTLVKDGSATLSLGGGTRNDAFTGDVAVASGTLALTTANSLRGSGGVILNAGTTLTATGDQALRALYGAAGSSVTVDGVLTLGANVAPAQGEARGNVTNNLGTSTTQTAGTPDASFARFRHSYDRLGNLVLKDDDVINFPTQKDATAAYLTANAKLAYIGYDAAALKDFVGKKVYTAANGDAYTLTQDEYEEILAYAANGGRDYADDATVADGRVNYTTLLVDLADLYTGIVRQETYESVINTKDAKGKYSPEGLRKFFENDRDYQTYVDDEFDDAVRAKCQDKGIDYDSATPDEINPVIFDVLAAKYDALTETNWTTEASDNKAQFAGIPAPGAFAAAVTEENGTGTLVDTSWISEPSYAGTLTATRLVKTGDGVSTLTGTLTTSNIVVNAGTLEIAGGTLAPAGVENNVADGISVARGASLSVNTAKDTDVAFNFAVSGEGNFVKTGDGKLTLGEDVKYTGTTTISGGTLQLTLREPQTTTTGGVTTTLAGQGDIVFGASDTTLILAQPDDVVWNSGEIRVQDTAVDGGVSVEKTGEGALTISGDVALGGNAELKVSQGALTLGGTAELGAGSTVTIAQGTTLSLSALTATGGVSLVGEGALAITGNVSLSGGSAGTDADDFSGTVTVDSGATLTLSGDSLLDDARVVVAGTLSVENGSTQEFSSLSGTGTLGIEVGSTASIQSEAPVFGMETTTGRYIFDEEAYLNVPAFDGTVSGTGMLEVRNGAARFPGTLDGNLRVSVGEGGQLVLSAEQVRQNLGAGSVTVDADAELVLFVDANESVSFESGKITFANSAAFGKVGDGTLVSSAEASTLFGNVGKISVYEGCLEINGWVDAEKYVAEGATLSVTLGSGVSPDLTTVIGSGVFELTAQSDITITNSSGTTGADNAGSLPTYSSDGKFFNGAISFVSGTTGYNVNIVGETASEEPFEIASISSDAGVTVAATNVTFVQSLDTEIAGTLGVTGDVSVRGATANSGKIFSSDHRRLTVSGDVEGSGSLSLKNVGFGFNASAGVQAEISNDSTANAFYVNLTGTGATGASASSIAIAFPENAATLKELSLISTSAASLSGTQIAEGDIFGISVNANVFDKLNKNSGVVYVGTESGELKLDMNGYTGKTADGVDVDLVTLRSAVSATAGTLVITDETKTFAGASNFLADDADSGDTEPVTLSETVRGGGNVAFEADRTVVNVAQQYTGTTTVREDATVELSGEGRRSATSNFIVADGGTLVGGVELTGREVSYSGTAVRNAAASGAAGSTTLTLSVSDSRLSSAMRVRVEISGAGVPDGFVTLGTLPAGITLDAVGLSDDGVLVLTVTDAAINGETYEIRVPVDVKAFPSDVGGHISLAGTTNVAGNFTLAGDGRVSLDSGGRVLLDAATLASSGSAAISVGAGTATLAGNIAVSNLNESVRGQDLVLVSAGTITNGKTGTSLETGSAAVAEALRNENFFRLNDKMKLMVYTAADGSVAARMLVDDFAATSADYSDGISGSFLSALSTLATGGKNLSIKEYDYILNADDDIGDGAGKDMLFALSSLTSSQLAQEVDKLSPNAFASMLAMPVAAFNGDVARLHARLDQRRYDGASPLRESGEYEFFALAQTDFTENDSAKDTPLFDYNLYGVSAGFDWKPTYASTLGLALGYTYGKAKMHDNGGKVEMDDMRVTAFGSYLFGNFYVEGGVQAGTALFDTRRDTIAGTARGDTDSLFAGTFVTVGAVYTLSQDGKDGSGLYLTPNLGLSYLHTRIDGFKESGTAGLDTDDADGDSLRLRAALGLQWRVPFETWVVRLGLEAAYAHDFLGDELDIDGRFTAGGNAFGTSGKALPKDVFSLSPTLDIGLSEKDSLWLGYEIGVDTDSGVSHSFNAGFRRRF